MQIHLCFVIEPALILVVLFRRFNVESHWQAMRKDIVSMMAVQVAEDQLRVSATRRRSPHDLATRLR